MTAYSFWVSFHLYLRRAVRDWLGWILFIILPIGIVVVLSLIGSNGDTPNYIQNGYNMPATHASVGIVLMFQLIAGGYLLHYFKHDFFGTIKWRLRAAPCPVHNHIFTGIAACTIFTVLQGLFVAASTAIFLNAHWGNWAITVLSILLISLIAQLVNTVLLLIIKSANNAGFLSWAIAYVMTALAGVLFALPDNSFFAFTQKYGTPVALAKTLIMESGKLRGLGNHAIPICLVALSGYIICFAVVAIILGRRKLA